MVCMKRHEMNRGEGLQRPVGNSGKPSGEEAPISDSSDTKDTKNKSIPHKRLRLGKKRGYIRVKKSKGDSKNWRREGRKTKCTTGKTTNNSRTTYHYKNARKTAASTWRPSLELLVGGGDT